MVTTHFLVIPVTLRLAPEKVALGRVALLALLAALTLRSARVRGALRPTRAGELTRSPIRLPLGAGRIALAIPGRRVQGLVGPLREPESEPEGVNGQLAPAALPVDPRFVGELFQPGHEAPERGVPLRLGDFRFDPLQQWIEGGLEGLEPEPLGVLADGLDALGLSGEGLAEALQPELGVAHFRTDVVRLQKGDGPLEAGQGSVGLGGEDAGELGGLGGRLVASAL